MGMAELVERYWTAEDVRALPEDGKRYECIDGVLLVTPAPRWLHQRAVMALIRSLDAFVSDHSLGEFLSSPADIELEPGTLVQPDLFVAHNRPGSPPYEWHSIAGLLLAIEVLSPSTARRDRGIKREFYQRAGVQEYWIVDLDARLIERWTPVSEHPEVLNAVLVWSPHGASESLEIDLVRFFAAVLDD
jgi:Uma2 family endonuclease